MAIILSVVVGSLLLSFTGVSFIRGDAIFNQDNDDGRPTDGSFWQIADIHYDVNYSSPVIAPNLCQVLDGFRNSSTGKVGMFGDYECDSSWALVASAVKAMNSTSPKPDFILWTGDSIPHISNSLTNMDKVYSVIRNVTDLLVSTFPGIPIYPMLGNHDVWPAHQIPVSAFSSFYSDILTKAGWEQLLDSEAQQMFKKGGYFTKLLPRGLRLICLNSNLWYTADKLSQNETDPADQFHWLEIEMQNALNRSERVILAGHVPPGVLGRAAGSWMYPTFNNRLLWLMRRYGRIISAAIFGHEHTDSFRIVYDNGKPVVPLFMAPAVTPWNSTLPGMGANNPAVRLYHYSRSTGFIKKYTQYYLNLSDANALKKADWQTEYQTQKVYNLPNLNATSLDKLVSKFKEDGSVLFQRFYDYNSVSLDRAPCIKDCKVRHICSMTKVDINEFNKCILGNGTHHWSVAPQREQLLDTRHSSIPPQREQHHMSTRDHRHHHEIKQFTYYLLGAILILLVILFFVVAFCCCRRRHAVVLLGRSRYALIQEA